MFPFLSRRHAEDVRVLEFIHAMRGTTPAPAAPVSEDDTAELPLQLVRLMVPVRA